MIAALDCVQREWRRDLVEDWFQLSGRAEGVAASLREQHRTADVGKMRVTKLIGPAGRMQRVAQQDDPGNGHNGVFGSDVRCDAPAHRFAANKQPLARSLDVLAYRRDDRAIACDELWKAIGDVATLFGVEKIECDDVEPALSQCAREADHERAALARPGTVREDERGRALGKAFSLIDERGSFLAAVEGDFERDRIGGHTMIVWRG